MIEGTYTQAAPGALLVDSADFPRYSLAFIFAEELSADNPAAVVTLSHPTNGVVTMQAGRVLPVTCACGNPLETPEELSARLCGICSAPSRLTVSELIAAVSNDLDRVRIQIKQAKTDPFIPNAMIAQHRATERRLKGCLDVLRFYLETAEEAVTVDVDAPLPIEVTPAGRAYCGV